MINRIKSFFILLIVLVVNSIYPVENRHLFGFPTFAIYAGKIPIYATLSGSFTFYPEKEMQKIESFLKTSNSKIPITIRHGSSYLTIKYENTIYKFHELNNIQSEWNIEGGNISISGQIPNADVEIFGIIQTKESKRGTFVVSYKAINRTNRIVDIGFRSLIDIGSEDEVTDEPIVDVVDGGDVVFPPPEYPTVTGAGFIVAEPNPREKIRVNGVEVKIINERVQYLGADGRIITESLKDYTKKNVIEKYATLETFLNSWKNADKKKAIVEALEQQGIFFEALKEEIGKDFDPFDLICHVAFEAKPLTRKERANNVKKRNYFTKYGEKAQSVIKSLLDKYADDDLLTIESLDVLKLDPLNKLGSPLEIINAFGGKENYIQALKELENELYKAA